MNVTTCARLLISTWMPTKQKIKLPRSLRLDQWATVIIEPRPPSVPLLVDWKRPVRFRPNIHRRHE